MGLLKKLSRVIRANLNDLICKAEDPKKMLEQIVLDMEKDVRKAKQEVAIAIADEKNLQRKYLEEEATAEAWEKKAVLALEHGRDSLAEKAVVTQQRHEAMVEEYKKQWEMQKSSVDALKTSLIELNQKLEEARRKKNLLIARQKRTEAQKKISSVMAGMKDFSAFEAFARMEKKVSGMEDSVKAEMELEKDLKNEFVDEDEFLKLGKEKKIQERLNALKQNLKNK